MGVVLDTELHPYNYASFAYSYIIISSAQHSEDVTLEEQRTQLKERIVKVCG